MNRGAIPGFYYDEEKKKYFRIQPNHVTPEAKYTKSNVKREQRESKKRKIHDRNHAIRRRQTVRPSRALTLDGMATGREVGQHEPSQNMLSREAYFVSQLQPSVLRFAAPNHNRVPPIVAAHLMHDNSALVLALGYSMNSYRLCKIPQPAEGWERSQAAARIPVKQWLPSFTSPVISIASSSETLVVCTRQPTFPGNVLVGFTGEIDEEADARATLLMSLGSPDSSLWAASMSSNQRKTAIASSESLFVVDTAESTLGKLPILGESRAIAWLNTDTVVYGQPPEEKPGRACASVHLWDIRSSGTALRFNRKSSRAITGLHTPNDSGVHILASDNRFIDLYDTRMNDRPLLSYKHVHQGPQLQFSTYQNIVAALDADNNVQMYSLRSGKHLGTKRPPQPGKSLMTNLKFYETGGSAMLLACHEDHLVRWTFGGPKDDE